MNKKKVILIHPPSRYLLMPKWTIPLTLLSLRSYLISKDYNVEIVDLADAGEDYLSKIPLDAYAYGVTLYTPQDQLAKDISFYLRERTKAILVAGGHHVTFTDIKFLEDSQFDAVVRGEGELALEEIIQEKPLNEIKGITYRKSNAIIRNGDRPFVENLDIYPFPRLDGVNVKEYPGTYVKKPHSDYRVGTIFSRGCVGECSFCTSVNFWKRKVRFHSYEWIREHVEYLVGYGVKDLEILDDNFVIHRHFKELCLLFKKKEIRWSCMGISKHITDEKSKLMSETGCSYVALGIESGSERLLKKLNNSATVEDNIKAVSILKKHNITVKGLLMVGLPGTTQEDIDLTVKFIKDTPIDFYGFGSFVPFPGTPVWDDADNLGSEIDKTIPFSEYLMLGKEVDIRAVSKNAEVIINHRRQLLEAMGDKCTIYGAFKRAEEQRRNKNDK